ncbi:MAG TPA: cytochrome ubiquinol oxidase subunit I [Myxococcota bacterium]|nr:cytochrome ubiquinol oxidase subunit I [Myxococcota bacterium]HRY96685.1 cytochrome ubiquinol oxidase subunit I [Myxococcota bacterium]HSA20577.1 cytochrome ubiquinol oxidase subunit I [Myxococcota bacterium]
MDTVLLARLQFAFTIGFHFIFPPISIGLAWALVVIEGLGWRTGDQAWVRLGKFFGKLLAITFAVGVATGVVMEFQFGTNWATYSRFVGDVFGAPLAAEAVFAFFLESGFLGLYLFGRNRVSRGVHWFAILMVAVGATLSAFWILVANSWQQTPAGFTLANGRAELTSFAEAVWNPSSLPRFFHTMVAALVTGGFAVMGASAWLALKGKSPELAPRALKLGAAFALAASLLALYPTGHWHAQQVAATQPEKFAAIEGIFDSQRAAPLVVFGIPGTDPPGLSARIEIPGLGSWLAHGDVEAEVKGLRDFPADQVPRGAEFVLSFLSFHHMVMLGMLFIGLSGLAALLAWRRRLATTRWFLWLLVLASPLPVAACQLGWITAEVGRQPWIVYRLLRTAEAASPSVSAGEILASLIGFGLVYLLLGALWLYLVLKKVAQGPEPPPAAGGGA